MEVALVDEAGAASVAVGRARFTRPTVTVREVIRARVELTWEAARAAAVGDAPDANERGFDALLRAQGSIEDAVAVAERGFLAGHYFLLLDDQQADDLDMDVDLARTAAATFLLLTPLKGG